MDPRHLVQLAVILEKGSITRASQQLHLTQPTLTHNMQTLEMQAGGALFERSRFGVRSTSLGELLAREGRAVARHLKDAAETGARHRGGLSGLVRLGAGPLVGAALLPGLTTFLARRFPDMALTLHGDHPYILVDQLIDGRHDLVIGPSWLERPPPGIERLLLIEDDLGIFCGRSHPLAARKTRRPAKAAGYDLLSLGAASPFDKAVREMLKAAGIEAGRTHLSVIGEAFSLLSILAAGRHLAVLPRFPLRQLRKHFPLVELPLSIPRTQRHIYLWCRADAMQAPGMPAIRDAILEYGKRHATASSAAPDVAPRTRRT